MSELTLFWYRQDLRLADLPGLAAAAKRGPVLPVYILDDDLGGDWAMGGASRWWLHHSLERLGAAIAAAGGELLLKRGATVDTLCRLVATTGATAVYSSRQYQPWADPLERALKDALATRSVTYKRYPGTLLFEPGAILSGAGTPFKVFTPFWRACLNAEPPEAPLGVPAVSWAPSPGGDALADWALLPTAPNWAAGWEALWTAGEAGAGDALDHFLAERVPGYAEGRDIPAEPHTSRLSPHLKFGELSPRQVWHAAQQARIAHPEAGAAIDKFLAEIGWREFCNQLVAQFPAMADQPFKAQFADFPWRHQPDWLRAWQRGQTGYPIVDAGMRELWQTGFMHNRVRMITASFLTKHLLTHWRAGEAWFWDCLLDADLASNACSWQWVAGSGADAAPYFRIFNPVSQGEKFDKAGDYVRRWVPELAELPNKYIHQPWTAPPLVRDAANLVLGETYPEPIVDHKAAREGALAAYASIKKADSQ